MGVGRVGAANAGVGWDGGVTEPTVWTTPHLGVRIGPPDSGEPGAASPVSLLFVFFQ